MSQANNVFKVNINQIYILDTPYSIFHHWPTTNMCNTKFWWHFSITQQMPATNNKIWQGLQCDATHLKIYQI